MKRTLKITLLGLALVGLNAGCGASDAASSSGAAAPPITGISQAGAQDFGLFRQILDEGEIPAPNTLDDLGFFAEHKLDYPEPNCGQNVCMHSLLGVMGNMLTGSSCTLIQIGMNTPIDVTTMERPPLNLVVLVDTSGSMAGEPIEYIREGLKRMLDHLEPDDTVSLVTFSDGADAIIVEAVPATDQLALKTAIAELSDHVVATNPTNLFHGLFTAFQVAELHRSAKTQNRVILASDGVATDGITSAAKMRSLAESYARKGIATTTIGVGKSFDIELMRSIAEAGGGSFYFLENPSAVKEVFTDEVKTFMVPIAVDVKIELEMGEGYRFGDAYGTNGFVPNVMGGTIKIPSLFIAGRTDSSAPSTEGRRGGGGAILLELLRKVDTPNTTGPLHVGTVTMTWHDPVSAEMYTEQAIISNPNSEELPEGYFTDFTVEKGFVMLNLLVAFQLATEFAQDSDTGNAIGILSTVAITVEGWLADHADPDIEDDLIYVYKFIANLEKLEKQTPIQTPPEPWPAD